MAASTGDRSPTNRDKRLTARFDDDEEVPVFQQPPLLTGRSHHSFILERHDIARGSLPTHVLDEHCLMLPLGQAATAFNARVNGAAVSGLIEPRRLQFRARGDSLATAWNGAVDAIFLAISPHALGHAISEDGTGAHLELVTDLRPRDHAVLRNLTLALEAYLRTPGDAGPMFEESMLISIAAQLVHAYGTGRRPPPAAAALSPRMRARLDDYIHQCLSGELSIARIAKAVGYSPYHLCRVFRVATGRTLWQYVLECRVAEARKMILRHHWMPLAQVAQSCGFGSYSQFVAAFRKVQWQTPSQFRRSRTR